MMFSLIQVYQAHLGLMNVDGLGDAVLKRIILYGQLFALCRHLSGIVGTYGVQVIALEAKTEEKR